MQNSLMSTLRKQSRPTHHWGLEQADEECPKSKHSIVEESLMTAGDIFLCVIGKETNGKGRHGEAALGECCPVMD